MNVCIFLKLCYHSSHILSSLAQDGRAKDWDLHSINGAKLSRLFQSEGEPLKILCGFISVSNDVTNSKSLSKYDKNKMRHGILVAYLDAGAKDKVKEIVEVSCKRILLPFLC